jgi:hypothetical protein
LEALNIGFDGLIVFSSSPGTAIVDIIVFEISKEWFVIVFGNPLSQPLFTIA